MFLYALEILFKVKWIKSSEYHDGASVKLKYLDSYNYIENPVPFIIHLEDSHFWSRQNMLVSHQSKS